MLPHTISSTLLTRPVSVMVVGAGGSGSQMLTGLAQLHHAMVALGHPGGLKVTAADKDQVSMANVGRQLFYPSDVGQNKADVLIHRINTAMGTDWESSREFVTEDSILRHDVVIGCVDTRASRQAIWQAGQGHGARYWLDMGNKTHEGQVILGEFPHKLRDKERVRLPTVADLMPEACDPAQEDADTGPSCSLAIALEKQSLFVNRGVSLFALNLLFELFRYGGLENHGAFINLKTARTAPLKIDPETWKRFGYGVRPKRSRKKASTVQ